MEATEITGAPAYVSERKKLLDGVASCGDPFHFQSCESSASSMIAIASVEAAAAAAASA